MLNKLFVLMEGKNEILDICSSKDNNMQRTLNFLILSKFKYIMLIVWILVAIVPKVVYIGDIQRMPDVTPQQKVDAMLVKTKELTLGQYYEKYIDTLSTKERVLFYNRAWNSSPLFTLTTLPIAIYVILTITITLLRGEQCQKD